MNKDIMRKLGFGKEVEAVEKKLCPLCYQPIDIKDFPDEVSKKEYEISGICASCQRETFE